MRPIPTLALLLAGTAASAEIAPDALWQRWQSGEGALSVLEGEARQDGDALVVEDAVLRLGRGDGAPRLAAGTLRLEPEGEETRITPPDSWRIEAADGTTARVTAPGLDLVVGGTAESPVYRLDEPELEATALVSPEAGESVGVTMTGRDVRGEIDPATGLVLTAAEAALRAAPVEGPESLSMAYQGLHLSFEGPPAALAAPATEGVPYAMSLEAEGGRQVLTAPTEAAGTVTVTIASGPSRMSIAATEDRIDALQSMTGVSLTGAGPAVPMTDARIDIAALTAGVSSPAAPVAEPAPVTVDLGVAGLSPSEEIWQLFDPGAALPRDPADLRLSLAGDLSWRTEADPPVPALERAQLEALRLSALGATLTGQGGVQFRPPATPGSPGRPLGALTFALTGANALLDRLSTLPSVPQGQLLGIRMALGLFTRPGEGEDSLVSEVEFAPDGAIVVNGTAIGRAP